MTTISEIAIIKKVISETGVIKKVISVSTTIPIPSFDTDALAYFNAAGITDNTEKNAVNTLVIQLKDDSIWTKLSAIYPISPTSLSAAEVNLRTPGTFDITWVNTPTHSSTGVDFNGTTQYGKTGLIPSTDTFLLGTSHGGVYLRENSAVNFSHSFGADTGGDFRFSMNPRNASNAYQIAINGQQRAFGSTTDSRGWTVMDKDTIPDHYIVYKNGLLDAQTTPTNRDRNVTIEIYISALNSSGTADQFGNKQVAFYTFGETLSSGDHLKLYNAIQDYQTNVITGGRQL